MYEQQFNNGLKQQQFQARLKLWLQESNRLSPSQREQCAQWHETVTPDTVDKMRSEFEAMLALLPAPATIGTSFFTQIFGIGAVMVLCASYITPYFIRRFSKNVDQQQLWTDRNQTFGACGLLIGLVGFIGIPLSIANF
jgi:hypothetical protein